ncbi:MAG: transcriptional repressor [Desulforegulaceae bacterium]|nr:transcriptional repressor [Desulforegulaceae bacterium]
MKEANSRFEQMIGLIKNKGNRLTNQRIAVVKILSASKEHPSADTIYKEVKKNYPATSLATVYKTINLLKEYNEVMEIGFADKGSRYDGYNPNPHPHLICEKCGKIKDAKININLFSKEIEKETGFKITSNRLDFYGVCPDCLRQDSKS